MHELNSSVMKTDRNAQQAKITEKSELEGLGINLDTVHKAQKCRVDLQKRAETVPSLLFTASE